MIGLLAVLYLFLGGAGAGVIFVCSLLDLAVVKQRFGFAAIEASFSTRPLVRIVDGGFAVGLFFLFVGILSLLFDLGRIERVATLFTSPTLSFLSFGSFVLALLILCSAFLALVRFLYLPDIPRLVVAAVEVVAAVLSLVTMAYTGMLLQSNGGVAFWNSLLIPMLFLLSSLSSGIALLFIVAFFVDQNSESVKVVRMLARTDMAVIVLEGLCAAVFVVLTMASNHPGVTESLRILFQGEVAPVWWMGFILCGLVMPLVIEAMLPRDIHYQKICLALVAVLVLVGAYGLRWSIVDAGVHREPVLENVPSSTESSKIMRHV